MESSLPRMFIVLSKFELVLADDIGISVKYHKSHGSETQLERYSTVREDVTHVVPASNAPMKLPCLRYMTSSSEGGKWVSHSSSLSRPLRMLVIYVHVTHAKRDALSSGCSGGPVRSCWDTSPRTAFPCFPQTKSSCCPADLMWIQRRRQVNELGYGSMASRWKKIIFFLQLLSLRSMFDLIIDPRRKLLWY